MNEDITDNVVSGGGADEYGRIDGWPDFTDRVRAALAMAAAQPTSILMMDHDFARWPIGERSMIEGFQQWVLQTKLPVCTLIAATLDELPRKHPRWVAWRSTWGHRVTCRVVLEELADAVKPTLLLEGQLGLKLLDPVTGRGVWSRLKSDLTVWRQEFDAISQRSHEAMPSTTLGL